MWATSDCTKICMRAEPLEKIQENCANTALTKAMCACASATVSHSRLGPAQAETFYVCYKSYSHSRAHAAHRHTDTQTHKHTVMRTHRYAASFHTTLRHRNVQGMLQQAVINLLQPVRQAYLQQRIHRHAKCNIRILRTEVCQHLLQQMHGLNPRDGPLSCLSNATLSALHT